MGYTDSHGRPEIIAQPFIAKGTTSFHVVDDDENAEQPDNKDETRT